MRHPGQTRTILMLVLPALGFLVIFFLIPLAYIFLGTFRSEAGNLTLQRYIALFSDPIFWTVYKRTLYLGTVVTVIAAVLAYPTAYLISRMAVGRRSILMALVIMPLMTNPVARTFAWLVVLGRFGLINRLLTLLGLISKPLRLIYTENAILVGLVHLFMPLMILTLVSAMENIPADLEEAAQSLGANRLNTFLHVILPLSSDGLILGGTLVFTGSITAYVTPAILGGTRVLVLATLLYQRSLVLLDWGSATVIAIVMLLSTLVVYRLLRTFRPKMV